MRITISFVLLLWFFFADAQTFFGRVEDTNGEPLPDVSVILQNKGSQIIAFTRSQRNGSFSISVPESKHADSLSFSIIGFRKVTRSINDYKNGQTVRMDEEVTAIREVVVRPQRITAGGDTLNYLVSGFIQKQDRSIADVIAKMPGLEVKADGSIEYLGRKISKFYVEGMDLMGGQYAQISENLSADKIKTVQVLENHQPIKVLKNTSFSQQAAINLVLRDNAKNVWTGIADIGTGITTQGETEWVRDVKLMEMVFGRRKQSVTMYKNNNTGKDIQREVQDLAYGRTDIPIGNPLLRNISLGAPSIGAQRSRMNDTHIVATNWLLKTKKDDDLRIQLSGLYDRSRQEQNSEIIFLDAGNSLLTSNTLAHSIRSEWKGELSYKVNRDNYYLSNITRGYIDFNHSEGMSVLNNQPIQQEVIPRKRYLTNDFEIVRQKGASNSYSISSQFAYSHLPGKILLTDSTLMKQTQSLLYLDINGHYEWGLNNLRLTMKAGVRTNIHELSQDLKDRYEEYRIYTSPALYYRGAKWTVRLTCHISNIFRKYSPQQENTTLATSQSDVSMIVEPHAYISYQLSPNWTSSLSYNHTWLTSDLPSISMLPLYYGQTTQVKGTGTLESTTMHMLSAELSHRNVMTGWFSHIGINHTIRQNSIIYNSILQNNIYVRTPTDYRKDFPSTSLNANVGKAFTWWSLTTTLEGSLNGSTFYLLMADSLNRQKSHYATLSLSYSLRPVNWFSIEGKSRFMQSKLSGIATYRSFAHRLKLFLSPGKWLIGVTGELYHSNDHSMSTSFFTDAQLSYRTEHFEWALECFNLFGTLSFQRRYATSNQLFYSYNELRPRELMVRICCNI